MVLTRTQPDRLYINLIVFEMSNQIPHCSYCTSCSVVNSCRVRICVAHWHWNNEMNTIRMWIFILAIALQAVSKKKKRSEIIVSHHTRKTTKSYLDLVFSLLIFILALSSVMEMVLSSFRLHVRKTFVDVLHLRGNEMSSYCRPLILTLCFVLNRGLVFVPSSHIQMESDLFHHRKNCFAKRPVKT